MQQVRLYISKVSPFVNEAFSKNLYLNQCIEDMLEELEGRR